ncbi:MAG: hypothetical protein J0L84_09135 [Verrucomicrobia bacterium]|nr:hypothetical protein [Verrucomicrobiota bacterium]
MNLLARSCLLGLCLPVLVTALSLRAQTPVLVITNPAPSGNEDFGSRVSVVGESLFIAAPGDEGFAGSVHVHDLQGAPIRTLTNPTPALGSFFGMALVPLGSDQLLISAPLSAPPPAGQSGAVHLFHTNGTLIRTFRHPRGQRSAVFGGEIAAMGDDRVLIGSILDDLAGPGGGAAYLYRTDGVLLATFPNPSPVPQSRFGAAFAVLGSDRFLVGAPGDPFRGVAGVVHLFSADGSLLRTLNDPNGLSDSSFGATLVRLGGDRILIGAPSANVEAPGAGAANIFDSDGRILAPVFNPEPALNDGFGSPAMAVGDDQVLIGSTRRSPELFGFRTEAYLFSTNGTLLLTLPIQPVSITANNAFAYLPPDRVLIGVPGANLTSEEVNANSGAAYLFRLAPALKAALTKAGPIQLSWPSPWTGWSLQERSVLASDGWQPVLGLPEDDGARKLVPVSPDGSERHFRLFKP